MEKNKVANFRRRIIKAQNSFGVMGDMLLTFDIDAMSQTDRIALRDALRASKSPLSYKYLDESIAKEACKAVVTEFTGVDALKRIYG